MTGFHGGLLAAAIAFTAPTNAIAQSTAMTLGTASVGGNWPWTRKRRALL